MPIILREVAPPRILILVLLALFIPRLSWVWFPMTMRRRPFETPFSVAALFPLQSILNRLRGDVIVEDPKRGEIRRHNRGCNVNHGVVPVIHVFRQRREVFEEHPVQAFVPVRNRHTGLNAVVPVKSMILLYVTSLRVHVRPDAVVRPWS